MNYFVNILVVSIFWLKFMMTLMNYFKATQHDLVFCILFTHDYGHQADEATCGRQLLPAE